MRETILDHDGGAIVGRGTAPAAVPAREAPADIAQAITDAHREREREIWRLTRAGFGRLAGALRGALKHAAQSAYERYLEQATDLADLERRQLEIERGERLILS